jgi:SUKH-3 immunity protein
MVAREVIVLVGDATARLLAEAGWYPGRRVDVFGARELLESRGYVVGERVEGFLREFERLCICYMRNACQDSVWFDAQRAGSMADPELIAYYESRTKTSLVPVGYANHEHLLIMKANEGGFYAAFDDFLCTLGIDTSEMVENLINQDREPLI